MAKQKKKRNKVYAGSNAATTRPVVTHISAVNRNKASQWWVDNKRLARPVLIVGGIVIGLGIVIVGFVDLIIR